MELDESLLPEGSTPLHIAVNNRDTSILASLLQDINPQALEIILNRKDRHGRTALGIALELGRSKAAAILIREGASLDISTSHTCSKNLSHVLENPTYQPLVQTLVKEGLRLPLTAPLLQKLLHSAVEMGDENLLSVLLEDYNVDVDCRDALGLSSLHYACLAGHSSFVHILMKYGASIALQDSIGRTAVHIACARGHLVLLQLLTSEFGASEPTRVLNVQDISGRSSAHVALYCKQFEVLAYLLSTFRSDLDLDLYDANGHTLPGLLFYFRLCLDTISRPHSLSLPCLSMEEATWALHVSVHTGDMALLKHSLASRMAVVDCFDFMDLTPLMWAARQGNVEACQALLEGGADINLSDHLGNTSLHHACYGNHPRVAHCILSNSSLKLDGFIDTFSCSLSAGLLESFLDCFTTSYHPQKPNHWQKWLSLAAENLEVTRNMFAMLVEAICPYNWLQQLANGKYEHSVSATPERQNHSHLAYYNTEWTKEEPFVSSMKSDSLEAFKTKKSKIKRKPIILKKSLLPFSHSLASWSSRKKLGSNNNVGRTNSFAAMKFKKVITKSPNKKPPLKHFYPGRGDNKKTWYPLHEAARSGNASVLDYILGKAENESGSLFRTLLFEVKDYYSVSVVELMAAKRDRFAQHLSSFVVDKYGMMKGYGLPESMSYVQALMHYLIVSSKPELFRNCEFKEKKYHIPQESVTPLDRWSPAYRRLRFHLHIADSGLLSDDSLDGVDDPYLLSAEAKEKLLVTLLDSYGMPDDCVYSSAGYMTLLGTAVKLQCIWAVKLLIQFGATGLVNSMELKDLWNPICGIVETGEVDLPELLGDNNSIESLSNSQVEYLCYGLLVLASRDQEIWTERLYNDIVIQYGATLWMYPRLPRLIYLSLSNDWTSFASQLIRDMVRAVCKHFIARDSSNRKQYMRMMKNFELVACFFTKPFQKKNVEELNVTLQIFSSILEAKHHFFHHLCMRGKYDAAKLVLNVMDTPLQDSLFSKCTGNAHSPLFYAAINGHLNIISLLFDNGCPLTDPKDGLLELRGAVLHIKLLKDTKFLSRKVIPSYVKCPLSTRELHGGSYSPRMVEYLVSKSDLKHIVTSTSCLLLLSEIASLPSLDLAQPVLQGLETQIQELQDTGGFQLSSNAEVSIEEMLTQSIGRLPPHRRSSSESLCLMDSILCSLSSCDLDSQVITVACEKGLWLLTKKFLPVAVHVDKVVVHIIDCAIRQAQHDCFSLVCSELKKDRQAITGLSEVLSSAVKKEDTYAVEVLLEFKESNDGLIVPLCLAALKHLNSIAVLILTKIISQGGCSMESFHKVLNCAARHNNSYIIESILYTRENLPISNEDYEQEQLLVWLTVLAKAARHGHEDLALTMVASLTVAQFDLAEIEEHELYIDIVNWCCYWGMAAVLNHLPLTSEVLLMGHVAVGSDGEGKFKELSPWSYAEAGGSVGKLAHVESLDLSRADLKSLKNRTSSCILLGTHSKYNSIKKEESTTHAYNWDYFQHPDVFVREAYYGRKDCVQIFFLDHMGSHNRSYFQFICKVYHCDSIFENLLHACCKSRNDSSTLNVVLENLASSGIDFSDNSSVKRHFTECITVGKVSCIQAFIQHMPCLLDSFSKAHLLNTAVSSKSPEMVDFILSIIGDLGPDSCLQEDIGKSSYPLLMAFSLGCSKVICSSSLLATASRARGFEFSKWNQASICNGWFHFMMEENAKAVSQSGGLNVESSETYGMVPQRFSLSAVPTHCYKVSLLQNSVYWGMESVVNAVLKSSGGIFMQVDKWSKDELTRAAHVLMNQKVLNFMREQSYCEDGLQQFVERAQDVDLVEIAMSKLTRWQGSKEELIEMIYSFHFICKDSTLYEKIFWNSCILGLSIVAVHLLNSDIFGEEFASVMQRGLQEAIVHWHWDIAAEIMLKLNISDIAVEEPSGNELIQVIFSKESYLSILNKFYSSLTDKNNRLPLAAMWLAYNWSRGEAELVVSRLGSMYAPPNPWLLPREKDSMVITIDWNSFSESLLASPSTTEQSGGHFRYVPIVIEAIVFSPAVLGQVVPSFCNCGRAFEDLKDAAFLMEVQGLSSLIISCSTWPSVASLTSLGGGQGLLTIVYEPNTRMFVFPEVKVKLPEQPVNVIPPENSLKDAENLSVFYKKKVKALLKLSAFITFGEKLSDELKSLERYCRKGEMYYCLLVSVFGDIFGALELIFSPKFSQAPLRLKKKVISAVDMQLDYHPIENDQPVFSVVVSNSVISVIVYLPCADEFSVETSELCTRSFYNELVDTIREAVLMEHVRIIQEETKPEIEKFASEVLASSLNVACSITVSLDSITPSSESNDFVCKVEQAKSLVAYVRQVNGLKLFVKLFFKMLSGHQYDSRYHFRSSLEAIFNIVCTGDADSPLFEYHHGILQMFVPVHTLRTRSNLYDSLFHAWQSFISAVAKRDNLSSNTVDTIQSSLAPVACYVDYERSPGLLFPVKGKSKTITVQLLDYNGHCLKSSPSPDTLLKVKIDHCESKLTIGGSIFFSSGGEVSGKHLTIRDNKDKGVTIDWLPCSTGLHTVNIFISGVPVHGSPQKCICVDSKPYLFKPLRTFGQGSVFVVKHPSDCSPSLVPLKLFNKKPIRNPCPLEQLSREEFLSSLQHGTIHYLSMYSVYGGSRKWCKVTDAANTVNIHISSTSLPRFFSRFFRLRVHSLSNGIYHVSRSSLVAGSYSLFSSCPHCQCVMKVYWDGNSSLNPVDFTVGKPNTPEFN